MQKKISYEIDNEKSLSARVDVFVEDDKITSIQISQYESGTLAEHYIKIDNAEGLRNILMDIFNNNIYTASKSEGNNTIAYPKSY